MLSLTALQNSNTQFQDSKFKIKIGFKIKIEKNSGKLVDTSVDAFQNRLHDVKSF